MCLRVVRPTGGREEQPHGHRVGAAPNLVLCKTTPQASPVPAKSVSFRRYLHTFPSSLFRATVSPPGSLFIVVAGRGLTCPPGRSPVLFSSPRRAPNSSPCACAILKVPWVSAVGVWHAEPGFRVRPRAHSALAVFLLLHLWFRMRAAEACRVSGAAVIASHLVQTWRSSPPRAPRAPEGGAIGSGCPGERRSRAEQCPTLEGAQAQINLSFRPCSAAH